MCVCVCVCACARALRIVSTNKILYISLIYTFIILFFAVLDDRSCLCLVSALYGAESS